MSWSWQAELRARCRVCLASDRALHRLADTPLAEAYERVTGSTLMVVGRPWCVCSVCLSALLRSSRFIDAARQANHTLDRWIQDRKQLQLMESPLFSLSRSATDHMVDIWPAVKLESDEATDHNQMLPQASDNSRNYEHNFLTKQIKCEVPDDFDDCDKDKQQGLDDKDDKRPGSDHDKNQFVWVEIHGGVKPKSPEMSDNIKDEISSPNVGQVDMSQHQITTNPGPSATYHQEAHPNFPTVCLFACNKCDYKTKWKKHLKQHLVTHTDEKPFACDQCDFKCTFKCSLLRHVKTHNGEKRFSCSKCDFICIEKSELKKHFRIHTGERPFACDVCDFKCTQKSNLKRHQMIHTGEKPFACDKCDFKTSQFSRLKRHLLVHDKKILIGTQQNNQHTLENPIIIHTDDKIYACDECEFKTNLKTGLQAHLIVHSGEKPFECDECKFRCDRKSTLRNHLKMHTGEKPFACNQCEYKAVRLNNLKMHLLTVHTDLKPYNCELCGFRTKRKDMLERHSMIHIDDKPFACSVCGFKSKRRSTLKRHFMIHTGEKPHACDKCPFKTIRMGDLKRHLLTTHKNDPQTQTL